jgi:acyl-CoA thioester hydrolase/thioesterase-3
MQTTKCAFPDALIRTWDNASPASDWIGPEPRFPCRNPGNETRKAACDDIAIGRRGDSSVASRDRLHDHSERGLAANTPVELRTEMAASESSVPRNLGRTRFTSELQVRPDDIDMFQHVHSSRYLDYVLTARFDQMSRCYGMGMDDFLRLGLAWFQTAASIQFKRPLRLGERFIVTTWIENMDRNSVRVDFEIRRMDNDKLCCEGNCHYTLVNVGTNRAENIPDWIAEKYAV